MKSFVLMFFTTAFLSCQQNDKSVRLETDNLKYSAYLWRLDADTPKFYLAYFIDIDKQGQFSLMRHNTFMDSPKYFKGNIPNSLITSINEVFNANDYGKDYSIRPEDSFIYDGFSYCIDYKKSDSLAKKILFIPNKSPDLISKLGLVLEKFVNNLKTVNAGRFDTEIYSKELMLYSLNESGPLPKLEKPNVIIVKSKKHKTKR